MMNTAVKMKRRNAVSKGIAKICSHRIEWCLEGKGLQLWDADIEYIRNMLIENYTAGELCTINPDGKTVWGRWNIEI